MQAPSSSMLTRFIKTIISFLALNTFALAILTYIAMHRHFFIWYSYLKYLMHSQLHHLANQSWALLVCEIKIKANHLELMHVGLSWLLLVVRNLAGVRLVHCLSRSVSGSAASCPFWLRRCCWCAGRGVMRLACDWLPECPYILDFCCFLTIDEWIF
jgi:hypothetical protein